MDVVRYIREVKLEISYFFVVLKNYGLGGGVLLRLWLGSVKASVCCWLKNNTRRSHVAVLELTALCGLGGSSIYISVVRLH